MSHAFGHSIHRWLRRGAAMIVSLPLLAGCAGEEVADGDVVRVEEPAAAPTFTAPADFALPFAATIPPGVRVDAVDADAGDAVRFVGMTGDERDERAFLHLFTAPPATPEGIARELVRAAAESYRIPGDRSELSPVGGPPWAVETYPIMSQGTLGEPITGWVALGRHGGRWFHVVVQHPEEREEEFGRQVEQILDSWTWLDDGTRLAG